MIYRDKFELIKEKYGHYASWAVWADGTDKPKDNVGDLSLFEATEHNALLKQPNPKSRTGLIHGSLARARGIV